MKQFSKHFIIISIIAFFIYSFHYTASTVDAHAGHFHTIAQAQENTEADDTTESTDSASIDYILPYPGILPGHPFYKLKIARDKLQELLISSPSRKVEFYHRQADKGMFATLLLAEKGKQDLATEMALKAEHNMTLVNTYVNQMNQKPDDKLFESLTQASLKHRETLESARTHLDVGHQEVIDQVLEFIVLNSDRLAQLQSIPSDRWSTER